MQNASNKFTSVKTCRYLDANLAIGIIIFFFLEKNFSLVLEAWRTQSSIIILSTPGGLVGTFSVKYFSSERFEGTLGRRDLGGVCDYIKALCITPCQHQSNLSVE